MLINKDYILGLKELRVIANYGNLAFDENISELEDKITLLEIKNYGNISIPDNINQSMYDLVTENYGMINSANDESKENNDTNVLYGNMGYLEL